MGNSDIGRVLKEMGIITDEQLSSALSRMRSGRLKLESILLEEGLATEEEVAKATAKIHRMPYIDLSKGGNVAQEILDMIPVNIVDEVGLLPLVMKKNKLAVAIDDPAKAFQLDEFRFVLNTELMPVMASPTGLKIAIKKMYHGGAEEAEAAMAASAGNIDGEADDAPIIRLVSTMIESALNMRASDIHIEPQEDRIRVRFRIDGVLRESGSHPSQLQGPLLSRLKIMAGMNIAEKRKPQDGRIGIKIMGRDLDIRASILPSNHGESMVMRLLDRETALVSLEALGFYEQDYQRFKRIIKKPNGIFLVTGPTGSGKTTTLYAALKELNRSDVKLITAEDPVEYHLPGINQVQVKQQIGLTFARILRAMLRQAPDIILVGEIRDRETAEIAIQAALTGHLVFSTLHTNDAPSALARLIDMGVKPFLVSSSVQAVMAQRLIRTLCPQCKEVYTPEKSELTALGLKEEDLENKNIYAPVGCSQCENTGFRGRIGIFELMELDWQIRDMTFKMSPTLEIRNQAVSSGVMTPLINDGVRKVLDGTTSIREILKAAKSAETVETTI